MTEKPTNERMKVWLNECKWTKINPYLPFQHAVLLKRLIIVDFCFARYKRILGVECPALCKRCIISDSVQPTDNTSTAVTKMLNKTLDLEIAVTNQSKTYCYNTNECKVVFS